MADTEETIHIDIDADKGMAKIDKAIADRLAPQIKALSDALVAAIGGKRGGSGGGAGALGNLDYRLALAKQKTPADRLNYLQREYDIAPRGSAQQARAELAIVREEQRQAKDAARGKGRKRTLADRLSSLRSDELPPSVMDRALADPFESLRGPAGRVRLPRNPPPQMGETEAKNAKQQEQSQRRQRQQASRRPTTIGQQLAQSLGLGGAGGMIGRGFAGGAIGGFFGGAARGAVGTAGAAITGNVSGVIQGVLGGVQTVGTMLSALGPVGMVAGAALKVFGAAAGKVAEVLDNMVETLGQYSPKTQMALANLDIATEQFKMRMAERTEGLMESWIELKQSTLDLIESLSPVIDKLISGLKLLVDVIKEITDRFAFLGNKDTNDDGSLKYGRMDRIKAFFGTGPMKEAHPEVGGGANKGFANVNAMMLDDLGGGGTYAPQPGRSPGGLGGMMPPAPAAARLPGGGGLGLNITNQNEFRIQDQGAVDRAIETIRARLFDALGQHSDRVEFLAGMVDSRNAVDLAL